MQRRFQASGSARNLLLCALPPTERERLSLHLQAVTFSLGQSVCEPGEQINYCYFPTSSVISLLYTMQDGSTAEMGLVGNEGVLGIAVFLGGESTCSRALVAVPGDALKLPGKLLREEFMRPDLFSDCCCDTPRHSSRKFRKPLFVTAFIQWNSDSAVGCCFARIGRIVMISP